MGPPYTLLIRKPNFFIVGAPKCGTTAMSEYLAQHPDVFMPVKELHFFGSDLHFSPHVDNFKTPRDDKETEKYLSFFAPAIREKMVGESSVWYLYSKTAASEIRAFSPSAKIIIMLRNPVDMLFSLHSQFLWEGGESIENFEEALKAEKERKKGLNIPDTVYFVSQLFYTEVVKYTAQIERYLDTFGKESVHVIIFDEFKKNTQKIYRETLHFLGIEDNFQSSFKVINPNKVIRYKRLQRILRNPVHPFRKMGKKIIPQVVRSVLYRKFQSHNTQFIARPAMNPETKKMLTETFAGEIDSLSEILGKDLTFWKNGIIDEKITF